jgi:pimeloyl-ACP methyl ester carboxylesterase
VPENRSRPADRTIRLMVAKYPARSAEKRRDPVVYLAGGPGDIAPLEVNGFIAANFIHDRDIVVMSQRGTMFSEPALTCASIDNFARELLGLRFYSEATKRAHLAATEACHRELATAGADLSAYNSTESASDFADLRKELGYDTWNVYGNSYGSYLAQTLMRDHPEGIRSLVLDSVLPATYTVPANWWNTRAGFDNLFQACAAEPACNAAHPHLEETFTGLVNKLEAEPLTAAVRDPVTGEDVKVVLDGGALVDWLRNQTYSVPTLQAAPNRIDGLAAGDPDAIGDRLGSRESGASIRSRCPRPGLRARPWRQLSRRLPVRDAGGSHCGRSGSISALSRIDTRRRCRRLGVFQRRLPRGLEGSRRPGRHAPASPEQHPDAPHLWQLRYADVPRRGEGRGGEAVQRNHHQHPGHRALRLALVTLRPGRDRIVPLRSRRLRRHTKAA